MTTVGRLQLRMPSLEASLAAARAKKAAPGRANENAAPVKVKPAPDPRFDNSTHAMVIRTETGQSHFVIISTDGTKAKVQGLKYEDGEWKMTDEGDESRVIDLKGHATAEAKAEALAKELPVRGSDWKWGEMKKIDGHFVQQGKLHMNDAAFRRELIKIFIAALLGLASGFAVARYA